MLYLRARWYRGDVGRFTSPDTIIPNYQNPQSVNRYMYALGNPIVFSDPTGMYVNFTPAQVEGIQTVLLPWLFDSARRHNVYNTNMGDGAFAALIVTIIRTETRIVELMWDDDYGDWRANFLNKWSVLSTQCRASLADSIGTSFGDKSLGPANLKESLVEDLVYGRVRRTSSFEEIEGGREYFDFHVDYNLKPLPEEDILCCASGDYEEILKYNRYQIYSDYLALYQDLEYTIDLGVFHLS